jgi:hypothetical protein
MTLNHRRLLTFSLAMLSVAAVLGGATTSSGAIRAHSIQLAQSQPLYDYNYYYPAQQAVRPGCYLPSDGCPNADSVQN